MAFDSETQQPVNIAAAAPHLRPRWYAVYTCSRHEKQVAAELELREIEHFLPLYPSLRRWKDRRVEVELPLFPGYLFVHIALCDRLRVLQVPGVVSLVGTGRNLTPVDEGELNAIRTAVAVGRRLEPHPYLKLGERVRVIHGSLAGAEGILVRKKGKLRVVLSLDLIMRAVSVEVDVTEIEPIMKRSA